MSGSTSGTSLGACGTLGMSPRLIPPHSVGKPYTPSPPSSIVTFLYVAGAARNESRDAYVGMRGAYELIRILRGAYELIRLRRQPASPATANRLRRKTGFAGVAALHKEMIILSSVLVRMGYSTSCVGINLGDPPRGLRHPRGVPSVDPSTLGKNILIRHSPPSSIISISHFLKGMKN